MKLPASFRSLFARRPRTAIAAVAGILCVVLLVTRDGHDAPQSVAEAPAKQSVIAPRVPLRMIFRPLFKTPDHSFEAGAAFLARSPFSPEPLLFTALQNIGPAGGYHTQAVGDTLGDVVSGIELRDAYSGEKMLSPEIEALPLAATAPLGAPSDSGDVAAFRTRGSTHLDYGFLSEEPSPPPAGSHVWLAFGTAPAPSGEAEESSAPEVTLPRIHHGTVTEFRDGLLYYTLDDPAVPLSGSSGAPLLAEGGRIVGIHLGATSEAGKVHGIATPVSRFLPALRNAFAPVAATGPGTAGAQN